MAPLAFDFVVWFFGVRGQAPKLGDYRPVPTLPAPGRSHVVRILAVTAGIFAALSLALWSSVWFAIQLL